MEINGGNSDRINSKNKVKICKIVFSFNQFTLPSSSDIITKKNDQHFVITSNLKNLY